EQPGAARLAGHDANRHAVGRGRIWVAPALLGRKRGPGERPEPAEGLLDLRNRRASDLDPGVTPGCDAPGGIAYPSVADTKSADEADASVHDQALPVVPVHPAQGARQPKRV